MQRKRILVTGATGFIGRNLVAAFCKQGYEVVAAASKGRQDVFADKWILGDISQVEVQHAAVEGCLFVVNAAGYVNKGESGKDGRERMFRINSDMPESLAIASVHAGVKRFLQISSTGVYGHRAPRVCIESATCHPKDIYESSKRAGEERLAALQNGGMEIVIARPSNVFGEWHPWNKLLSWMKAVQHGKIILSINPNVTAVNYVYIQDVVKAIVVLLESPFVMNRDIFNINTPSSTAEFFQATVRAVGGKSYAWRVPRIVLTLVASMLDGFSYITGWNFPLTQEKVRELNGSRIFLADRLTKLYSEFPSIGMEEGLVRLACHYRNRGLL